MGHLLYLMFRYDGDVMKNLDFERVFGASKHTPCSTVVPCSWGSELQLEPGSLLVGLQFRAGVGNGRLVSRACQLTNSSSVCFLPLPAEMRLWIHTVVGYIQHSSGNWH